MGQWLLHVNLHYALPPEVKPLIMAGLEAFTCAKKVPSISMHIILATLKMLFYKCSTFKKNVSSLHWALLLVFC